MMKRKLSMVFKDLAAFIKQRMHMSHIYQPAMLMCLLRNKGRASREQIAKAFLLRDESQIEYYEEITDAMVGKILRKHSVVIKEGHDYILPDFDALSQEQIQELEKLCETQ